MRGFNGAFLAIVLMLLTTMQVMGQSFFTFHHLTTEDGLSNSTVNTILKDSYGFLWVGTEYGLNRYDGYGFKKYTMKPGVPNTLAINNISGLQEDGLGNIWIRGFTYMVYRRDKDNFITDVPGFLQGLGILIDPDTKYKVYVDKKKDLWILNEQKVFFYDTYKGALQVFNLIVKLDEGFTAALSDDGRSLYGILKAGSLWQIDKETGNQTVLELKDISRPEIYDRVYADNQGDLWLFSDKTDLIYHRKNSSTNWRKLLLGPLAKTQSNKIIGMLDDESGHIWIGTDHNGLFIYDRASDTFSNFLNDPGTSASIASNNVQCLYKDDVGVIWMGHNKNGVSYYHDSFHNIVNFEDQNCRDVSVILEDRDGSIWLGTDGNGLYLKEKVKGGKIVKLPIGNLVVVSLLQDKKGRIWIGTYSNGLFCYENGKFSHFTKDNSRLAANDVWGLKEDRYGHLWIGTLGGGLQYLSNGSESMDSLLTVQANVKYPLDMYYDGGDKLYIGTIWGLRILDVTTKNYDTHLGNSRKTQKFIDTSIFSVFKDKKGNIWLGHPEGLSIWDLKKDTIYYVDKKNGLNDNIIRGIIEDDHGNLWVTTSNGVTSLSYQRDMKGHLNIACKNFSTKDGFADSYFNNRAICKLRNGDILLGQTAGFTMVNPNKINEKKQLPSRAIFTRLSVENHVVEIDSLYNGHKLLKHPMEQTDFLKFSHNDRLISLQFTTGELLNADQVKYAYKLEGLNNKWINTQENKVSFSSLNPGNYKLLIKTCNSDGIWNNEATTLNIVVTPPFYLSRLAILLYILSVISVTIYLIYRLRKHNSKKLEQQIEQSEREMKLRFFTNISHELRTPLTLITTPLQTILNEDLEAGLQKKLHMISKNAEQLLSLINKILDFRKLDVGAESLHLCQGEFVSFTKEICVPFHVYAVECNLTLSFSSEIESLTMQFDPDKMQKIMSNLLSNAFKFTSSGGKVGIHVFRDQDYVYVNVGDSGQGIGERDKKHIFEQFYRGAHSQHMTGSGIGLHMVSEYVQMHGGTITVADNVPKGSIFTLKLPIVKAVIREETDSEELNDLIVEPAKKQNHPGDYVLLFVDDNKDFCQFMSDSLSDEYTVLVAHNGLEAIEKLKKNNVSLVISDVMMPVMDGTELCRRIKTNIQWSHIPVILLTARTAEQYKMEGLEMGADDYLNKPFNFNMLKLRILKFLEWTEKCHDSFSKRLDVSPSEITITPLDEQLIGKAIKAVEERIGDTEFSVEDLGREVGLGRSQLYKKLMSITGKAPSDFIRTIRLKRGRQLLEKSQLHITEIAYEVGFNTPKRFTINFKNEFGVLPSEYRKSLE